MSEERSERSEGRYRRILDGAMEGVIVTDPDGLVSYANEAAARACGLTVEELVGEDGRALVTRLFSGADGAFMEERFAHRGQSAARYEVTLDRPDGTTHVVLISGTPFYRDDGTPDGSVALLTDVTERRQAEQQYRLLAENATDAITVADASGRLTYVSPSAKEVLGYTADELLGTRFEEHLATAGPARPPVFVDSAEEPDLFTRTVQFQRRDGASIWVELAIRRIRDELTGTVVEFQAAARDVTDRVEALAALHDSERRLQTVIDQLPAVVLTMETDLRLHSSAGAGLALQGIRPNTSVGRTLYEVYAAADRPNDPDLRCFEQAAAGSDVSFETEWGTRQYLMRASPLRDDDGNIVGVISVSSDVTEWKAAEQRYRLLAENSTDVISTVDASGVFTFVSPAAAEVYGYPAEDMTGHAFDEFLDPEDRDRVRQVLDSAGSQPDVFSIRFRFRRQDMLTIWVESTVRQVRDPSTGDLVELEASTRDVTSQVSAMQALERSEAQLQHRAAHDALTGLPNRELLRRSLEGALARGARSGQAVAVLFVDIDNFKFVNDSLGHLVGDQVLTEVGVRIGKAARTGDMVARFGGDEYVVVCEPVADAHQARAVAERICSHVDGGFEVAGQRLRVNVSIGVALGLPGVTDAHELLRNADTAMYHAKQRGGDRAELFDATLSADARRRLALEVELRDAVDADQLLLHYQPVVDLATGRIVGTEALVRWQHPTRGLLSPNEFLVVAESSGLIIRIGARVLMDACLQGARWLRDHPERRLTVAVNVSLHQLAWGDFVRDLDRALEESGFDPTLLRLEMTETALLEMTPRLQADLQACDARGVQIGIDDFGTGYSSLAYLKHFPVRFLKIDKTFIDGLDEGDSADTAIVDAILRLGEALSLETIAEGVESAEQLAWLRRAGCSAAQGYLFGRPLAAESVRL